jgi:hypothetical protein
LCLSEANISISELWALFRPVLPELSTAPPQHFALTGFKYSQMEAKDKKSLQGFSTDYSVFCGKKGRSYDDDELRKEFIFLFL